MSEQRRFPRIPVTAEILLRSSEHGSWCLKSRDLSDLGVFLLCDPDVPLVIGEEVQLQVQELEDAPVVAARVVRREPEGVALKFCDPPE